MKKIANQILYNLKKEKSSFISFGIIILITAMIMNCAAVLLRHVDSAYDEKFDTEKIAQVFDRAYETGENHVEIKCQDAVVFREIYGYLIEEQNVFQYLNNEKDTVSYYEDEELLMLEFWLK